MNPEVAKLLEALSEDDRKAIMKLAQRAKRKQENRAFREEMKQYGKELSSTDEELREAGIEPESTEDSRVRLTKKDIAKGGLGAAALAGLAALISKKHKWENPNWRWTDDD